MKIKAKKKGCILTVNVKASPGEVINEKELDRFSRVFLRGFLKPRLIKTSVVEYTGPLGVSLFERLKKPITKRDFLLIIEQIVVAVQKLQNNRMPINNLVMFPQYIYVNEKTKEVQFLYIPTTTGQVNLNLIQLFGEIIKSLKPADVADNGFAARFNYHFKTLSPFSLDKVEQFVALEDRSVVSTVRKQSAGQSGFMTNKQQHYIEYQEKQAVAHSNDATDLLKEETDEATGLLQEESNDATGLLQEETEQVTGLLQEEVVEDEATGLLIEENEESTGLLVDEPDETGSEETGLLNEIHYPTLFRVLTGEYISINKPVYRIGKERSYVDYFVSNNIAVSRSHADIITRGNKYFVIDLNSKNHTYINGRDIGVQCEVELSDGDNLRLANEEFVFNA